MNADFAAEVVARLEPVGGIRSKKMMGGLMIWSGDDAFALVTSDDRLCLKADETTSARFEEAGGQRFERMPYWEVPADVFEDDDALRAWAGEAVAVARRRGKGKRR